jgi:hypothetical protein
MGNVIHVVNSFWNKKNLHLMTFYSDACSLDHHSSLLRLSTTFQLYGNNISRLEYFNRLLTSFIGCYGSIGIKHVPPHRQQVAVI